ncbi:sensor histidine kinase [Chelativorans sp. YIM 93263]|uniref:sensor histidine kinase n=1 Tax=Chelativorans sp. YIM 93263 TaxID=2906648 RepID=UPI0023786AB6|nr:ATP-binding protein [Chelativorans sp. YIM 93263]
MKSTVEGFRSWSLMRQFAVAGGLVMLAAASLAGYLVAGIVSKAAVENTATSSALFMENILSPLVQELANERVFPETASASLDDLLGSETFENRYPHIDIWKPDGLVVYSKSRQIVGQRFPPPEGLLAALNGDVAARYTDLDAAEHVSRQFEKKYLEIYVPLREYLTGRIIAVAEVHEQPAVLASKLFRVRAEAWMATIVVTAMVMAALFGIVYRANRTIQEQRRDLHAKIRHVRTVSEQNRTLKERAQRASSRLAELNAKYLRSVGAELHDGPTQLMGLAALKVGHIRRARSPEERQGNLDALEFTIAEAINDIRTISKGLMLPEIENLPLCEVVGLAVASHKKRTDTDVSVECQTLTKTFPQAVNICVYRFVQEGLNNAFKHALGLGQSVSASWSGSMLTVSVRDAGSGESRSSIEAGLGLIGMHERVESLGGTLTVSSMPGGGTRVEMRLSLSGEED